MAKANPTYNIQVHMVDDAHYEAIVAELDITVTAETFKKVMLEVERAIVVHLMEMDRKAKKNFPVSGLVPVALPVHRCYSEDPCIRYSLHVVMPGNEQETMCGKDCANWQQSSSDISQLLSGSDLHHKICIPCHRELASHIKQRAE